MEEGEEMGLGQGVRCEPEGLRCDQAMKRKRVNQG